MGFYRQQRTWCVIETIFPEEETTEKVLGAFISASFEPGERFRKALCSSDFSLLSQ